MWQALRDELNHSSNDTFELITVGLDALGNDGCQPFMEAAKPTHPALIDRHHVLAEKFGVTNIPSAIWIDENGVIVRPPEAAPAPPAQADARAKDTQADNPPDLSAAPERLRQMMEEAAKIPSNPEAYHQALRDWVSKGADSKFALSPDEVIERSQPRSADIARGHAHFEIATALEVAGKHEAAIAHFKKAHELVPDSWTFRRQAWSLESAGPMAGSPLARFWQGPAPDAPEKWPYEGGWLEDIKREGAENYNEPFRP